LQHINFQLLLLLLLLGGPGEEAGLPLSSYFRGDKKRSIEDCTRKCVPTCIRGGGGEQQARLAGVIQQKP
jgi:hypothetical protein